MSSGCVEMQFLEKVKCEGMWRAHMGLHLVCVLLQQLSTWAWGARYFATRLPLAEITAASVRVSEDTGGCGTEHVQPRVNARDREGVRDS